MASIHVAKNSQKQRILKLNALLHFIRSTILAFGVIEDSVIINNISIDSPVCRVHSSYENECWNYFFLNTANVLLSWRNYWDSIENQYKCPASLERQLSWHWKKAINLKLKNCWVLISSNYIPLKNVLTLSFFFKCEAERM